MEYFEELALVQKYLYHHGMKSMWMMSSVLSPKVKGTFCLTYLNSIDPHIKVTVEQPNADGAYHSWTHSPNQKVRILLYLFTGNLLNGQVSGLQFTSPISAKKAVVRALMDRAENVCSDPDILSKK